MFYDVVIEPLVKETKLNFFGNYRYVKSSNEKINTLRLSASKYLENSLEITEFISSLEKIIIDKDYYVIFDDTIVNEYGQSVNGQVKSLNDKSIEIRLNPNSRELFLFVIIHELTHVIETSKMKDLVLDFISKDYRYSKLLNKYLNYENDEVFSEILADICGYLFGSIEFINHLSIKNVNIFVNVYRKILELSNKLTGNKEINLFIKNLKFIWEYAYRNNEVNFNGKTKYSLQTLKDGTKYVQTETNMFTKEDGSSLTQREIYKSLIGKNIILEDGSIVEIVNRLSEKDMYNELFKRYPRQKNIKNIKDINKTINENFNELLSNSKNINTRPDVNKKHDKLNIENFNTREVLFYDGNLTYKLTLSIANLKDGKKIAYAKKMLKVDNFLLDKIKQEGMSSTLNKERSSQFLQVNSIVPQSNNNVNNCE